MGNTDRKSARKRSCATKTLAYTYDAAGQIAPTTDSNGQVSTYTYTDTGLLDTITAPGGKVRNGDYNGLQKRVQTRLRSAAAAGKLRLKNGDRPVSVTLRLDQSPFLEDAVHAPEREKRGREKRGREKRGQTRLSNYRKASQSPFFALSVPVLAASLPGRIAPRACRYSPRVVAESASSGTGVSPATSAMAWGPLARSALVHTTREDCGASAWKSTGGCLTPSTTRMPVP